MKKIFLGTGVFLTLAVIGLVFFRQPMEAKEIKIGDSVFQVEIADDPASRTLGLSGRDFLAPEKGMLFIFEIAGNHQFWMKDMKFPIDIIWIRDNQVVGMVLSAEPETEEPLTIYNPPEAVDMVLEINAGLTQRLGIKVGDTVSF